METDQYIGVDLHKALFQVCAITPSKASGCGKARFRRTAEDIDAVRRPVYGARPPWRSKRRRRRGICRSDHRTCRERLRRRYAEDETQSGLCGEDGSTRCASPGGCAQPRKRGQHLHAVRRRSASSANCARHRLLVTQMRTRVLQRTRALLLRQGLGDPPAKRLRSRGGPGLARSTPAANPGAPRVNHDATTGPRSEHPARAGECRHRPRGAGRSDRAAAPTRPRDRPSARFDAPRRDRRHRPVPDPRPFWRVTRGWCPRSTAAPRVRATAASRKTARPGSAGLWSRWACRPYAGAIPWVGGAASSRCAKA